MLSRINCHGVTRVNTGAFDLFHNARNTYVSTIGNSVNLYLHTNHVTVDKNRMFLGCNYSFLHVYIEFFIVVYDFHSTTAQYIGRTNNQWIFQVFSCCLCFFIRSYKSTYWTRNTKFCQQFIKTFTVFRHVDAIYGCTENFDTALSQWARQVDSCLTTKLSNNASWFFFINDFHYIVHC